MEEYQLMLTKKETEIMQLDDYITNKELDEARECLERRAISVDFSAVCRAMAAYRIGGGNYTANDDTYPTEITFANGRKIGIAFDGDRPYLTVGRVSL